MCIYIYIYIYIYHLSILETRFYFLCDYFTRTFSFVFLSFEYPWAIHGCHGLRVRRFESDFKLEQVRTGYHGAIEMVPSLRNIFSLCCFFFLRCPSGFLGKIIGWPIFPQFIVHIYDRLLLIPAHCWLSKGNKRSPQAAGEL